MFTSRALILTSLMLVTGASFASPVTIAAAPAEWPAGDGQLLASRTCGQCHSVDVVMRHRLTRRQWMAQIDTMISKGAKVDDEDFDALADYLSQVFGPPVATP